MSDEWDGTTERRRDLCTLQAMRESIDALGGRIDQFIASYEPMLKELIEARARRAQRIEEVCRHVLKWGIQCLVAIFCIVAWWAINTHFGK